MRCERVHDTLAHHTCDRDHADLPRCYISIEALVHTYKGHIHLIQHVLDASHYASKESYRRRFTLHFWRLWMGSKWTSGCGVSQSPCFCP